MITNSTRRGVTIRARSRRGMGGKLPKPSHCRLGVREVFDRFDVDLPEGDLTDAVLEQANRKLSRRVYKYTDCGAWASVHERTQTATAAERWAARYERHGDVWYLTQLADSAGVLYLPVTVRADVGWARGTFRGPEGDEAPADVVDYFADVPAADAEGAFTDAVSGGDVVTTTHTVDVRRVTGRVWVFEVGSIVEGTDMDVPPEHVVLPCRRRDINRAIERVERAARDVWNETHGCPTCAERLGEDGPVDDDCPDCGGDGVVI